MAKLKIINTMVDATDFEIYEGYVKKCEKIIQSASIDTTKIDYKKLSFINSKNTLGQFNRRTKELIISKPYFDYCLLNNQSKDLENTIIHELTHNIAENIEYGCGHRGTWKYLAEKISRKTDYKIERCASKISCDFLADKHKNDIDKPSRKDRAKYTVKCECCGNESHYIKRAKIVTNLEIGRQVYRCRLCSGKKFELIIN